MPRYTYRYKDDTTGPTVELQHPMAAAPLARHPENGRQLQRVFESALGLTLRLGSARSAASNANLAKNGFQKYVRQGDGSYARTVGTRGPAHIARQ